MKKEIDLSKYSTDDFTAFIGAYINYRAVEEFPGTKLIAEIMELYLGDIYDTLCETIGEEAAKKKYEDIESMITNNAEFIKKRMIESSHDVLDIHNKQQIYGPDYRPEMPNNCLEIALEYADKLDLRHFDKEKYNEPQPHLQKQVEELLERFSKDKRVRKFGFNSVTLQHVWSVAAQCKLEEYFTTTSTLAIAREIIAKYRPALEKAGDFEKWRGTIYPKNIMEGFIKKALEFAEEAKLPWLIHPDRGDGLEATCDNVFMVAWHEGEQIEI